MSEKNPPILAAEDEESDALILRLAFQQAQLLHPLVVVRDGQEVVEYLAGRDRYADRSVHPLPALIILDLKMPRLSGFEVLAWLATQPDFRDIPVVVLSSSADESDIRKARELGAREYFVKPHSFDELKNVLQRMDPKALR
jgi:CheY-like chemotaxis protein